MSTACVSIFDRDFSQHSYHAGAMTYLWLYPFVPLPFDCARCQTPDIEAHTE